MCGRYFIENELDEINKRYELKKYKQKYDKENINWGEMFPTDESPIIIKNNEKCLKFCKWGFYSYNKKPIINARSETVSTRLLFKNSFFNRRCIVPVNAFFEWKRDDNNKIKYEIKVKDLPIFSLAGIYNVFSNKNNEKFVGFTILTTDANSDMKNIHHRMPIIITPENEDVWLDKSRNINEIMKILKPLEDGLLSICEVK